MAAALLSEHDVENWAIGYVEATSRPSSTKKEEDMSRIWVHRDWKEIGGGETDAKNGQLDQKFSRVGAPCLLHL